MPSSSFTLEFKEYLMGFSLLALVGLPFVGSLFMPLLLAFALHSGTEKPFTFEEDNFQSVEIRDFLTFSEEGGEGLAVSGDGRVATGDSSGNSLVFNVEDGQLLGSFAHPDGALVKSLAFHPDGLLAAGYANNDLLLWSQAGEIVQTITDHQDVVQTVAFSADGKFLASASNDGTLSVWQLSKAEASAKVQAEKVWSVAQSHGENTWVLALAFAPDSQLLASGGDNGTINLWLVATGKLQLSIQGHGDWLRSLAFAGDGQTLISGSDDTHVKQWAVSDGSLKNDWQGHSDWVRYVAVFEDYIVSAADDRSLRIWQAGQAEPVEVLEGFGDSYNYAQALTPDGKYLFGLNESGLRRWELSQE
jgi:WD40 repeat protein